MNEWVVNEPRICGRILQDEDGFHAVCHQTYGTDHQHPPTLTARRLTSLGAATHTWGRIEPEVWVPNPQRPGYLMFDRCLTFDELVVGVNRQLRAGGLFDDDGVRIVPGRRGEESLPKRIRWMACYAVTGGSEGHYIHVDAIGAGGRSDRYEELESVVRTYAKPEKWGVHIDTSPDPRNPPPDRRWYLEMGHGWQRAAEAVKLIDSGELLPSRIPLLIGKTFRGMKSACEIASACAEMLA